MSVNMRDMESLAQLLDKNINFTRPHGQTTGYSLEDMDATGPTKVSAPHPASIPLPSTVIDQQLQLPIPSHSRAAQMKNDGERPKQPTGNEIWTQEELRQVYEASRRKGPAVASPPTANHAAPAPTPVTAAAIAPDGANGRVEPAHTVLYQQKLTAEDMYLGVDFTRDNSSAASDGLVLRVEMPRVHVLTDLSITVEPFQVVVSSADYYLCAPLPRKVLMDVADAQWDSSQKVLVVQLKADQAGSVAVL